MVAAGFMHYVCRSVKGFQNSCSAAFCHTPLPTFYSTDKIAAPLAEFKTITQRAQNALWDSSRNELFIEMDSPSWM
jgi:hypothetical protein